MGQRRRIQRGASSLSLIREILLIKEALSSVQFAAIIAIKKAFIQPPSAPDKPAHPFSPTVVGWMLMQLPPRLVPATASSNPTRLPPSQLGLVHRPRQSG